MLTRQFVLLLQTAYRVLEQHPQVLGSRIAMLGLSFGTSVTLKMAAYSEVIKVRQLITSVGPNPTVKFNEGYTQVVTVTAGV